jgi:hypothetical protein
MDVYRQPYKCIKNRILDVTRDSSIIVSREAYFPSVILPVCLRSLLRVNTISSPALPSDTVLVADSEESAATVSNGRWSPFAYCVYSDSLSWEAVEGVIVVPPSIRCVSGCEAPVRLVAHDRLGVGIARDRASGIHLVVELVGKHLVSRRSRDHYQ